MAKAKLNTLEASDLLVAAMKGGKRAGGVLSVSDLVPTPLFDAEAFVAASVWICEETLPWVETHERARFDQWMGLARRQLERGRGDAPDRLATRVADVEGKALYIASRAVQQARSWVAADDNYGWARAAARAHAELLIERGGDYDAYLTALVRRCVTFEAQAMLRFHQLAAAAPLVSVQSRNAAATTPHWLLELAGGALALLTTVDARWTVIEGARDVVLAQIPKDELEDDDLE